MNHKIPTKPYSEKIIFIDTEFSNANPCQGELLSIGLVKMNGQELYLELDYRAALSSWVKKHVLKYLSGPGVSREIAVKAIKKFIGRGKPYIMAYVNQLDAVYLYDLFGIKKTPWHWIPLDFASVLFGLGLDPESNHSKHKSDLCKKLGIDLKKFRGHHALDDAKLLREIYIKLLKIS